MCAGAMTSAAATMQPRPDAAARTAPICRYMIPSVMLISNPITLITYASSAQESNEGLPTTSLLQLKLPS